MKQGGIGWPVRVLTVLRQFAIAALALLAISVSSWSAPPPYVPNQPLTLRPPLQTLDREPAGFTGMLAAHNRARHAVGVADMQWSDRLAAIAQAWAERLRAQNCAMRHSGAAGMGENLAWAGGQRLTPAGVVAMWVAEARDFNPSSGTCARNAVCGHYTQIVWRNTRQVGCGMISCGGSEVWVCNYSPPGNFAGERPY